MWPLAEITFGDVVVPLWLAAVWVFVLGAAVGSFLNVVIYRLPRGESLNHPPSRCPRCGTPIRWHDNVPIVGWLWLRGRCRACGAPISPRYPLVELLVALTFLGIAWLEVFSGGVNLPRGPWSEGFDSARACAIWAYHLLLICTLLAAAFMVYDGQKPPVKFFLAALVFGLAAPLFLHGLRPVPYRWPLGAAPAEIRWLAELLTGSAGAAAGFLMALLAWPATRIGPVGDHGRLASVLALVSVGAFLGWQAVSAIAVFASVAAAMITPVFRRLDFTVFLAPLTVIWVASWQAQVAFRPEWGYQSNLGLLVGAGCMVALFALIARWTSRLAGAPHLSSAGD